MRGKEGGLKITAGSIRITPACAGKRNFKNFDTGLREDHPRLCGEKFLVFLLAVVGLGSPPLVRGKVQKVRRNRWRLRITPACAGKSSSSICFMLVARDHPRLCGEKYAHDMPEHCFKGSPPLVRGKEHGGDTVDNEARITPACAGKSKSSDGKAEWGEDHPRLCGEKTKRIPL